MIYRWFRVFNLTDFLATGLTSRTYVLDLEQLGEKSFLVTRGNKTSVVVDGVFLMLEADGSNPFAFDGHAIFRDSLNDDVYIGFPR